MSRERAGWVLAVHLRISCRYVCLGTFKPTLCCVLCCVVLRCVALYLGCGISALVRACVFPSVCAHVHVCSLLEAKCCQALDNLTEFVVVLGTKVK